MTFKNAAGLRDALAVTPPDRLLVETDAPFLTPGALPRPAQRVVPRPAHSPRDGRGARPDVETLARAVAANTDPAFGPW